MITERMALVEVGTFSQDAVRSNMESTVVLQGVPKMCPVFVAAGEEPIDDTLFSFFTQLVR